MKKINFRLILFILLGTLILTLYFILTLFHSVKPSNDRDWTPDQKTLSYSTQDGNIIQIYNIRNITYINTSSYSPSYYNSSYNLSDLNSVWYIVEPFSNFNGAAHTFLSFGFNDKFIAVSVEIRKEKGEEYSAIKGLLKQYELMYVLGDERDLVKLRTNYRNDSVFMYPINTTQETIQLLFLDILKRVNKLHDEPEFYNLLTNTCTTNIAKHINHIKPGRIPFSLALIAPGYSDKFAYKIGIINTTLPYQKIRQYYQINERAIKYANNSDFPLRIRDFEHD